MQIVEARQDRGLHPARGRSQGATATVMQRHGEHWITVVGDVPPATLELFAAAVQRRR